ncbi:spirocyclase AveC family protein [Mycobacterium alsense]|uniref:Spirocyclase AveC family protein n=2 Tax=Mycobacterium alsense TaxID=324058 RepID=A0AA42BZY0_9MYCO|nr:spirocyclase AveC family protein [Mycobacterium alsense]MCV7380876.1 spirocyclase AveC family protein [Mycobacterium alsense]
MTAEQDTKVRAGEDVIAGGAVGRSNDSPPIVWLARLGAVFVALQAYVYIRWITSDQFVAAPTGPDKIPGGTMVGIRVSEAVCIVGGLIYIAWFIRKTLRDRAFPAMGVFVVAWSLAAWQDPGVNWIRPVFGYNSGFFNRGTWADFIPGWIFKGAENPQPIWYWLATYFLFMPLSVMGLDKLIRTIRSRSPRINTAGVIALLFVMFTTLDIVLEELLIHLGLWAYPRVNHTWSIFTGTMNQFPLYEGVVFGGIVSVLTIIVYCFRDKHGHMITDAGIDRLRSKRAVTIVRILALTAVFNLVMLVFNMGFNMVNQHADTMPANVPSYIHNQMCGLGPNPPCPPPS